MDIKEFFTGMLPAIISARRDFFARTQGIICIVVHGEGAWTLQFGDPDSPLALQEGINLDADLVATFSSGDFEAILQGSLESSSVKPVTIGNKELLSTLGHLMLPPARGGLAAQIATTGEWSKKRS